MHVDLPSSFAPAECDAIIELARAAGMEPATVRGAAADEIAPERRRAQRCHLVRNAQTAWLFGRLDVLFGEIAPRFGVEVEPVFEPVQVLRYGPGDHFQQWHSDAGTDRLQERQLSLSIELSEPKDHEGGMLEIVPDTVGAPRTLPRGGTRLFPSRAIHRVTPVTRGERWALVAWTGVSANR